jgi:hypothetical protein
MTAATTTSSLNYIISSIDGVYANRADAQDGYSGIYAWGAQLEAGSFATSYIPTVASQVTRIKDDVSMTGTNFSSWYRADEGTVYSEAASVSPSSNSGIYSITDSATAISNCIFGKLHTDQKLRVFVNGTSVANLGSTAETSNVFSKYASTYKVNDFAISNNGTAVSGSNVDTSGAIPVVSLITLGNINGGYLNGTIKKFAYYGKKLTNAELVGLTTI